MPTEPTWPSRGCLISEKSEFMCDHFFGLSPSRVRLWLWALIAIWLSSLVACGGGGSAPSAPTALSISSQPQSATVNDGSAVAFSVSATGSTPITYQWFKDGVAVSNANSASLQIPSATLQDNTARFHVTLTNSVGSVTSETAVLTVRPIPVNITAQPVSVTVADGASATFTIAATGSAPISYQWTRNGSVIPGATRDSYAIPSVAMSDTKSLYAVNVANAAGALFSQSAELTVNPTAPSFSIMPQATTVKDGASVSLVVQAMGTGPITLQWLKNGAAIPNATSSTLAFQSQLNDDGSAYSVIAVSPYGSATSSQAILRVDPSAPGFSLEPSDFAVATGGNASFSVDVTGTRPITLQWQRSDDGYIWSDIPGAVAPTLVVNNAGLRWAKAQVRATASNRSATVTSRAASLSVTPNVRVLAGGIGGTGYMDGDAPNARLGDLQSLVVDSAGNILVSDTSLPTIRKIVPGGRVSTLMDPSSMPGFATALAIDSSDNLYLAINSAIFKRTSDGTLVRLAGSGAWGFADGAGESAQFTYIASMAIDNRGNIIVTDTFNCVVRKVTLSGVVTTLAGNAGKCSQVDGQATHARFSGSLSALAIDKLGNIYLGEFGVIRLITPDGTVSRYAGRYDYGGNVDGHRLSAAQFLSIEGLVLDDVGNLYVAETWSIRRVGTDGWVTTVAGGNTFGMASQDGYGINALLYGAASLARTPTPNSYVFNDTGNGLVRRVSAGGVVTTIAGQIPQVGINDGAGKNARFTNPNCMSQAQDRVGALVVDNWSTVRKISADGSVATLAHNLQSFSFNCATSDKAGNTYITDSSNVIYKVTPAGEASVIAGVLGKSGSVDGPLGTGLLYYPTAIAVDALGNIWFAELASHLLRKVSPGGLLSTVAGAVNVCGSANGPARSAQLCNPYSLAVEADGSILIGEFGALRRLSPSGVMSTVAGRTMVYGFGDGSVASFTQINGIALDSDGYIFVSDMGNSAIRRISPSGYTGTVMGSPGVASVVPGPNGKINHPKGVVVLPNGRLFVLSEYAVIGD